MADAPRRDTKAIAQAALARNRARPKPLTRDQIDAELKRCKNDVVYFVNKYVKVYDNDSRQWIDFLLWSFQTYSLQKMCTALRLVILKTRQVGLTWLALAYALWQMLFWPIAEVLMFSQREDEALALLGDQRLHGMVDRLPPWMRPSITLDNKSELRFDNGSGARALPGTSGGDSRTVTLVIIDEADLVDNVQRLITRAKPTLGSKGQMFVIGRADKDRPNSFFKRLYVQAKKMLGEWNEAIFIPWDAHPGRTADWKKQVDSDAMALEGSLDGVHEMYPATDTEALQGRTLNKRFAPEWITAFGKEREPLPALPEAPEIPGLRIYAYPDPKRHYGIGSDPAGGVSDGDDAVSCVVDADTLEQVTVFGGKIEPTQFANYTHDLSVYYNNAPILPELNNHGTAMLAQLKEKQARLRTGLRRNGKPGDPGWMTSERSKHMLYDIAVKAMQDAIVETKDDAGLYHLENVDPILCDFATITQVASIDASELAAPENEHDDYAMAWALAIMCVYRGTPSMMTQRYKGLYKSRDEQMPDKLAQLQAVQQLPKPVVPVQQAPAQPEQHWMKPRVGESQDEWAFRIRFRGK